MKKKVRDYVLERDNHECQFGKIFGPSHISKVPCTDRLELHHITYERYNHEKPEDLITVCTRCHDVITSYVRELRHDRRNKNFEQIIQDKPKLIQGERKVYDENFEFQNNGSRPANTTQWQTSKSPRRICTGDESNYLKQKKNGRGSR